MFSVSIVAHFSAVHSSVCAFFRSKAIIIAKMRCKKKRCTQNEQLPSKWIVAPTHADKFTGTVRDLLNIICCYSAVGFCSLAAVLIEDRRSPIGGYWNTTWNVHFTRFCALRGVFDCGHRFYWKKKCFLWFCQTYVNSLACGTIEFLNVTATVLRLPMNVDHRSIVLNGSSHRQSIWNWLWFACNHSITAIRSVRVVDVVEHSINIRVNIFIGQSPFGNVKGKHEMLSEGKLNVWIDDKQKQNRGPKRMQKEAICLKNIKFRSMCHLIGSRSFSAEEGKKKISDKTKLHNKRKCIAHRIERQPFSMDICS